MVSKVILSALVALLVAEVALADPVLCPVPSDANQLVYKQNVREAAPLFGRTEKEYDIPRLQHAVSCITLTETATEGVSNSISISALGFAEDGSIKVKLVSGIQQAMYATLDVYTKE